MLRALALFASLAATPALAQPPVPPGAPTPPPPPVAQAPPVPPAPRVAPTVPVPRAGQPAQLPEPPRAPEPPPAPKPGQPASHALATNVQVELTITDRIGSAPPETKTVSLITSDATWGRIRAGANTRSPQTGPVPTMLNVDARPFIEQDAKGGATNRLRLELTLEYQPMRTSTTAPAAGEGVAAPTHLNQSLSVFLTSGVPVVVSQAADPITDRQVVVEVKATVMR
ncbi:MAG: hypothetical protein IT179_05390 [Acidobacteria bacterium]|nr:hypothetical protein [Acidobacteriota bacterium]